jgi:hypothetical protein
LARACANCGSQLSPTAKFCPECAQPTGLVRDAQASARFASPQGYTPKHLAEKILTSKTALRRRAQASDGAFCRCKRINGAPR